MRKSLHAPPTFVENLKRLGLIQTAVFAIYLGKFLEPPVISFGAWDLARYSTSPKFTFLQANASSGLWSFPITEAAFGNITLQSQPSLAVIDSSEKKLIVPKAAFDFIRSELCSHVSCFGDDHNVGFSCSNLPSDRQPSITFVLNGLNITISEDYYLGQRIRKKSLDKCILQVDWRENQDTWLLGFPFMRSHYLLFDLENESVGVALARQEDEIPLWTYWLLIVGIVVVVGMLAFLLLLCMGYDCCRICNRRPESNEESLLPNK